MIIMRPKFKVLETTEDVVQKSTQVKINHQAIERLIAEWPNLYSKISGPVPKYHFNDGTERTLNYILALDAVNFCFWPDKKEKKWAINYNGEKLNGYFALAASFKRSIKEGILLWKSSVLENLSQNELAYIFRGSGRIPLLEERVKNLHQVGKVLTKKWHGNFANIVNRANKNAIRLVELIIKEFPCFRDWSTYKNKRIYFLKRAQLLVADIYGLFRGKSWGKFRQLEKLTCFADYKIPQILHHFGILEYGKYLLAKIRQKQLLLAGSTEEIEIRANTIWAINFLKKALAKKGLFLRAFELDWWLWEKSQRIKMALPHHRIRTIFY